MQLKTLFRSAFVEAAYVFVVMLKLATVIIENSVIIK
jgi:hypothetical protein